MAKAKSTNREISAHVAICAGVITAFLITLLLTVSAGIFINNEYFEIGIVPLLVVFVQGISVFLGALIGGSLASERKVISCILVAGLYYLLLLCIALLFYEGITGGAIIGFGVCAATVFAAIMLCTRGKKRAMPVRKRHRRC